MNWLVRWTINKKTPNWGLFTEIINCFVCYEPTVWLPLPDAILPKPEAPS